MAPSRKECDSLENARNKDCCNAVASDEVRGKNQQCQFDQDSPCPKGIHPIERGHDGQATPKVAWGKNFIGVLCSLKVLFTDKPPAPTQNLPHNHTSPRKLVTLRDDH